MDIIVDIQFFKNIHNVAVPKEVGIVALEKNFIAHWVVSPKHPIHALSKSVRKENNWLTEHHHGVDYFDGEVTESKLIKILRDLTKRVGKIYVRGKEKWLFLQRTTARDIINLEYDVECPSFDKLPWCDNFCLHHALKPSHVKYSCALNNVFRLKTWLTTERVTYNRIKDSDPVFQPPFQLCDEQSGNFENFVPHTISYCGSVPSRSDATGLDETDSVRCEY